MAEFNHTYEILNYSGEPFLLEDTEEGRLIFVNDAAEQFLGISRAELIGERLGSYLSLFTMPGSASVWRTGSRLMEMEEHRFISNKKLKLIKLSKLETPVSERDLEMLKRVSAVFRHRLHSPLNAVSGFFELLKENLKDHPHEVEAIEGGIKNMTAILRTVTFFEELEEAKIDYADALSLTDIVKQNFSDTHLRNVSWDIKVNQSLKTDEKMMAKLITLLLRNALEANGDNFQKVEVEIKVDDDTIIRVRNYGSLISRKNIPLLFKPFFTTKAQNLGLGLTKAYFLAQKLNGFLYLRSNSKVDGICLEAIL